MPRIIECPDEPERMTFSQFFNKHQSQQDSVSSYVVSNPDDMETASESETSPILYSLRDKKVVSQSSQLLFLSQMNDAMDSPSTPSISVQQTSQHKVKVPNLVKPSKQIKPPSKVRSWEMESFTKSTYYYEQLISRFRSFNLSVGNISSHFTARELRFIFSQNRLSFSRTASKTHLSSALYEYIRNGSVSVPQPIQPSPMKPQIVSRMKMIARYPEHTLTSPSVETLLYSEFPRLYREYKPKPSSTLSWDEDELIVANEFPNIISIHKANLSGSLSQCTQTLYQDILLAILHDQTYPCNYWSCYNEDLFDFPRDSPIVIVVPMYAEKEDLLQSVYFHGKELTENLPFLSMTVLQNPNPNQSSLPAWIEVQLIDKKVFTILRGYFVYLLTVKFKDHTYNTIQLPWQLNQSCCFVSLSILSHYVGEESSSFNPRFNDAPVALSWIPKEGEVVAVQVHDFIRGCELLELGEIRKVLDPFHLLVQWLRIATDSCEDKYKVEYSPKETVLFPWDVYTIVMTTIDKK